MSKTPALLSCALRRDAFEITMLRWSRGLSWEGLRAIASFWMISGYYGHVMTLLRRCSASRLQNASMLSKVTHCDSAIVSVLCEKHKGSIKENLRWGGIGWSLRNIRFEIPLTGLCTYFMRKETHLIPLSELKDSHDMFLTRNAECKHSECLCTRKLHRVPVR